MKLIFPLILCLFLAACGNDDRARQAQFFAFGTDIDISLYGVDAETAERTSEALEQAFSAINDDWHAWQPSTLTRINEAIARGEPIAVRSEVAEVIGQAARYARDSQHLFNPAAGKLFELWGYHQDNWFESRPPPAQQDIERWLHAAPTMDNIHIENGMLRSDNAMVKLGFGAFAKGTAVDAAIDALRAMGIENALVNIGGDLRAIGRHGERPWLIGIRHPRKEHTMLASIAVADDESVFTSGDYERFFAYEGTRYPHILDPRTGYPAREAMSVTVIGQDAARADAAATALFVAGEDWPAIAASLGIDHVMLVCADGTVELSPAMNERVKLVDRSQTPRIREIAQ